MDNHSDDPGGRALLTAGLLVLAGTTGAAFGRVFQEQAPSARLVVAAGAAVLLAAVFERRNLALSVAVSAVGVLVALGLMVFPSTTFFGLPTPSTVEALVSSLGLVGEQAQNQSAPAPALPSLFSASLIAVWAASYSAHALAARARSAILALLPPAGLLAFAQVVIEDGARPGYAGFFLAASVAVLFASGAQALDRWGPILPRRRRASISLALGPAGRGARRLGLAVTAIALAAPGILPGFGAEALLDVNGSSGRRISISPLVDIRPNLLRRRAIELFTVRAERPAYWRLLSLDRYNGRFWSAADTRAEGGLPIPGGTAALRREPTPFRGRALTQEYEITQLGGAHLPGAMAPVGIEAGVDLRHDLEAGMLVVPDGVPEELSYRMASETVTPPPEDLDREFDFGVVDPRYLALPEGTPPGIHRAAQEVTVGASTPYRKALAIQAYLRNFTYDEAAPAGHGVDDVLFFLQSRRGYCEQFAGTMAVFLRSLGYPARVAVGFTQGTPDRSGVYHVTTDEAHSWVEMYFPGYGWLAFEPTPTRDNPVAGAYLNPPPDSPGAPARGEVASVGPGRIAGRLDSQLAAVERRFGGGGAYRPAAAPPPEEPFSLQPLLPLAPIAALLLVLAIPLRKAIRRRRLLRRAAAPRARVLAALSVFEERTAEVGLPRRAGETLAEYRVRLAAELPELAREAEVLAHTAGRALYSSAELGATDADRSLEAIRALTRALRRRAGRGRALVGAIRPAPGPGY